MQILDTLEVQDGKANIFTLIFFFLLIPASLRAIINKKIIKGLLHLVDNSDSCQLL